MKNKKRGEEISVSIILQKIKSGEMNARDLIPEERQACASLLIIEEGFTHSQVAQLLACSEKTVQRDIAEIRKRNSLSPSIELAKQLIGEMLLKAEAHIAHLMRLARSREGSVSERAQSELFAWKIRVDFMTKLQSLGYLPLMAQRLEGDFLHHFVDPNNKSVSFDDLKQQLAEIEVIGKGQGGLPEETQKKIQLLRQRIEKADIEQTIIDTKEAQIKGENNGQQDENRNTE